MSNLNIRPFEPTNEAYEAIVAAWNVSWPQWLTTSVDNGRYVGLTALWKAAAMPTKLYTGLTGVLRSHRRRGLATAMKTKAILYADSLGVTRIETDNEENNPMFQINVQLGFKPLPAVLEFHKKIKGRSHEPPD